MDDIAKLGIGSSADEYAESMASTEIQRIKQEFYLQELERPEGFVLFNDASSAVRALQWWSRMACQRRFEQYADSGGKGRYSIDGPPILPDKIFFGSKDSDEWIQIIIKYAQEVVDSAQQAEDTHAPVARVRVKKEGEQYEIKLTWHGTWTPNRSIEVLIFNISPDEVHTEITWKSGTNKPSTWLAVGNTFSEYGNQAQRWTDQDENIARAVLEMLEKRRPTAEG